MTTELFRDDAYQVECETTVIASNADGIMLAQTVFYPEGGGQPGDTGELEMAGQPSIEIIDTRSGNDGSLLHIPAEGEALPPVGSTVTARINWDRRYRHMRTHTCLHLLCALIPHDVTGGSISLEKGRLDFDMSDAVDKPALEKA